LDEQHAVFDASAERIWTKLVPAGTVDVKPVTAQRGVADYVAKELGHPISYETFVTPDELIRG
jgi:hypothetical protein